MVVVKALGLGLIAAVAVPWALRHAAGPLGRAAHAGLLHPEIGRVDLAVSLPVLLIVTAAGWALLRSAREG